MAAAIAAKHGKASRAVLFYGSCLREQQLDGLMLDFYLIVSDYRAAYDKRWLAAANRLIPPNVFHFEHDGLTAKYAVLSEADFARAQRAGNAQRVGLGAVRPAVAAGLGADEQRRERQSTQSRGRRRRCSHAAVAARTANALDWWRGLRADLFGRAAGRAQGAAASIVDADPERYQRFCRLRHCRESRAAQHRAAAWRRRRLEGKALSVVRLAKASATFAGGVDYIAWKINRHAGTQIRIKPWQRRWPLLAAITLLPRLLKSGAVR